MLHFSETFKNTQKNTSFSPSPFKEKCYFATYKSEMEMTNTEMEMTNSNKYFAGENWQMSPRI